MIALSATSCGLKLAKNSSCSALKSSSDSPGMTTIAEYTPVLMALREVATFPAVVLGPPERGVLGMPAMGYLRRTPGRSSGVPMNSIPAF